MGGQAATALPMRVGWAAAMLAASDAEIPRSMLVQASQPAFMPARRRTTMVMLAATTRPSIASGTSHARHPSPARAASSYMCMKLTTAATAATTLTAATVVTWTALRAFAGAMAWGGSAVMVFCG
ncbi:hypothetical protein KIPE111705_07225 [Kibdelosporangium persicum]